MLGILIPGVREVRAPLAAGTLLLVSVYLLLFDSADRVFAENRVSPGLESIYDLFGRTGMLVAGAVAAYLVGTVITRVVTVRVRVRQLGLLPRILAPTYLAAPRKPRLLAVQAPFSRPSLRRIRTMCEQRSASAELVLGEIVLSGGKRLLAANRDLYADYDRLQSEAQFRLAIVPPAFLLSIAVALQVPAHLVVEVAGVGLVGVIGCFILGDALALLRESNSLYAHQVVDEVVSTPSLDAGAPPSHIPEGDLS